MFAAHARRLFLSLFSGLTSHVSVNLLSGVTAGMLLLYLHHLVSLLFGVNPMSVAGLGLGCLTAVVLVSCWRWKPTTTQSGWQAWGFAYLALASVGCLMPLFVQLLGSLIASCGTWLQGNLPLFGVAYLAGLLLLGIPLAGVCRMPEWFANGTGGSSPKTVTTFLFGLAISCVVQGFLAAPLLGTQGAAFVAMTLGALLGGLGIWRACTAQDPVPAQSPVSTAPLTAASYWKRGDWMRDWRVVPASMALGIVLSAWLRIHAQWSPATAHQLCAQFAAVLGGMACGRWLMGNRSGTRHLAITLVCLVWGSLVFLAFPSVVQSLVWLNTRVMTPSLMIALRGMLPALVCFPLGIIWIQFAATKSEAAGGLVAFPQVRLILAASLTWLAYLATQTWGITAFGPAVCYVAGIWILASVVVGEVVMQRLWFATWKSRGLFAAAACVVISIGFLNSRYQPDLSARVLFASNILQASHGGLSFSQLSSVDEGRRVSLVEGTHGTYSVWMFHGSQIQIRENGVPSAVVSTDPEIFPHFSAELLPGVVPLVLHEEARNVLMLGLGSGTSLQACLASPVLNVVCVEPDVKLCRLIEGLPQRLPLNDERLTFQHVDPVWSVATGQGAYDVVISSPGQSALWHAAPEFTAEFFRNASRQLAPGGIFCQRIQYIDYGAKPLLEIASTLQSVFRDVMAIEMGTGEILFVATNSDEGLVRPDLLTRVQAPHVRELLSEVGWDWTLLLTLGAYDQAALATLLEEQQSRPNTTANPHLAYSLPAEIIRFGPKYQEMRQVFTPHMGKLLQWMGEDGARPEVLRRLSEVSGQHDLMVRYTDQYWAYRKSVRDQVTNKPLSLIKQVAFESKGGLHPEDRNRMRYFAALGRAAKSRTVENIEQISQYGKPFDPLLTYFLHSEVAELYAKAKHPDPRAELRHRLHAVYFTASNDRSLYNIHSAMALILDYPDACDGPMDRWDQLNGLLQMLQQRWEIRGAGQPGPPKTELRDIDVSLVAVERSFRMMDELAADAGLSNQESQLRQETLDRKLVLPLRSYRTKLRPLVQRHEILQEYSQPSSPSSDAIDMTP